MVDALPWGNGRHDRGYVHAPQAAAGALLDALDRWSAALGAPPSRDITGTYLIAAARCAFTPARLHETLTFDALAPAHAAAPLIRYIAGSCRADMRQHLDALSADADFHEVLFQRGRMRLFSGGATVQLDARALLEAARKAMPAMIANTYLLAGVLSALEEYEACAARYAEVAEAGGARRDATLNRTVCLTHAGARGEAIAAATTLIDTPGVLRGEAYFWRAWNQYHEKRLPLARADVEAAKPLFDQTDVYALSGFIAYDMGEKAYAHSEFGEAYRRNGAYCTAPFYRGIIDSDSERWQPALEEYLLATGCYETSARNLEEDLRQAERLDPANPTRQRRIDNLTAALDAERLQLARAAYNVAYAHGRLGNAALAIPFAEKAAATHKDMETLATDLLAVLRKAG
jgi:tetratricopeptide (TPR) repeat protein